MFSSQANCTFSVEGLQTIEDSNKSEWVEELSNQEGMLQPYNDLEVIGELKLGKTWRLFCDRIEIAEGKRIIINQTRYSVRSVKDYNFGRYPHLEIVLTEIKA